MVAEPDEKVALHLRVANLYLEKFSNQAEAIKAFEAGAGAGSRQRARRSRYLQADVREAPGLGQAGRARPQRDRAACTDAEERRRRRIEVARLASEKLKKPVGLDRAVAGGAGRARTTTRRRSTELEKLYEREKAWAELGGGARPARPQLLPAGRRGASAAEAGPALHREAAGRRQGGRRLAGAAGDRAGQPPGPGRASQAVHRSRRTGTRSRASTPPRASGTSSSACWSARPRPRTTQAKVGLWNKIGQLYRDRLNKADKAQKAFERALAAGRQQPGARPRR